MGTHGIDHSQQGISTIMKLVSDLVQYICVMDEQKEAWHSYIVHIVWRKKYEFHLHQRWT